MGSSVSRPAGRVLVVGAAACRLEPLAILVGRGVGCDEADDVYAAMAQLSQRPMVFGAIVLSLASLYREELGIIATIKQRYGHIEVWIAQPDGRAAALAESVRLGADALVCAEGIHRIDQPGGRSRDAARPAGPAVSVVQAGELAESSAAFDDSSNDDNIDGEPILTADELRALLSDQAPMLPRHAEEL